MDPAELASIAQKIISKGLYPTKGVKTIAWYVSTTDYWGIEISEFESAEAQVANANVWRMAKPGIFKFIRTSVAMKIEDIIPVLLKVSKQLKG